MISDAPIEIVEKAVVQKIHNTFSCIAPNC